MKTKKYIEDKKIAMWVFFLCWIVYFASYIGRLNYSSAMTDMIAEGVLTRTQAGSVSMVYFFCYGAGQLINGLLGDKLNPRGMLFIGLFFAGVANLLVGFCSSAVMIAVLWGINGYLQAMIWPPIIRIFSELLHKDYRMRYCVNISTTIPAGTFASYLLSAFMMTISGYRGVFFAAAGVMMIIAVVWWAGYGRIEKEYPMESAKSVHKKEKAYDAADPKGKQKGLVFIIINMGLWILLPPVIVHGALKDGITTWVPTFISESFSATAVVSILVTMVLPVLNVFGAYAASYVNRRLKSEIRSSAVFFAGSVMALVVLLIFGRHSMVLSILMLGIITSAMMAINTLLISLVPLHFGKLNKSASVSGFLNCCAYIGSAVSTFSVGVLVEHAGWNVTILSWVGIAALALCICIAAWKKSFASVGK